DVPLPGHRQLRGPLRDPLHPPGVRGERLRHEKHLRLQLWQRLQRRQQRRQPVRRQQGHPQGHHRRIPGGLTMDILRLISLLLDYPEQTLDGELPALSAVIDDSPLSSDARRGLWRFIQARQGLDLLDLQADYEEVFGRGRAHSLWLFEHVHGESRDRGQAMVDLLDNYRRAGLELAHNELPDYLPLFLEFLATQGEDNARAWLQDVAYILALVQCRLEKIGSDFAAPLAALVELAGTRLDLGE